MMASDTNISTYQFLPDLLPEDHSQGQVRFIHPFVRFYRSDGNGSALKDVWCSSETPMAHWLFKTRRVECWSGRLRLKATRNSGSTLLAAKKLGRTGWRSGKIASPKFVLTAKSTAAPISRVSSSEEDGRSTSAVPSR